MQSRLRSTSRVDAPTGARQPARMAATSRQPSTTVGPQPTIGERIQEWLAHSAGVAGSDRPQRRHCPAEVSAPVTRAPVQWPGARTAGRADLQGSNRKR